LICMNNLVCKPNKLLKSVSWVLVLATFFCCSIVAAQHKSRYEKKGGELSIGDIRFGVASFYADKFNGRPTASGEIFSQDKLTCACNVLPLGTLVRVTNLMNGKSVELVVNDRLHPKMRRLVDLSKKAAKKLGFTASGLVKVKVEVIQKAK
jgi:rare lipoprotein A